MRVLLGLRVMLAMLVAVLLPLGQAHCALTMLAQSAPVTVQTEHPDGDDPCCPESAPDPGSPIDPCCCDQFQLPSVAAPASISVDTPAPVLSWTAVMPVVAPPVRVHTGCDRIAPDARSGSPPDPSAQPQAPRGPPQSA